MTEEYRKNATEEMERFRNGDQGSSWIGNVISRTFSYENKSDLDMHLIQIRQFINSKVDSQTRQDILFQEHFRSLSKTAVENIVLELSLSGDEF